MQSNPCADAARQERRKNTSRKQPGAEHTRLSIIVDPSHQTTPMKKGRRA
jgi:hypothetical protein